jgi:carboxyl-terminal processing protease
MKNKFMLFALILSLFAVNLSTATNELTPQPQQAQAARLSAEVFGRHHYIRIPLDDALSAKIFDHYLKVLDGEKLFFLQSDIDKLSDERTELDDAILKQDMSIPFAIYSLYQQRATERLVYARTLLNKGFDFNRKESYQYSRKKAPWASSVDELNDLWRRHVKNDWLRLKLAGMKDTMIAATLDKRYENSLNSIAKIKSEDVFQFFMSAYAMAIDPHTDYFGMREAKDFDISMKLSLVGIGAVLQEKDEYTTIRELVPGGPAALSGKLKIGDRIVGVGQGVNLPVTDVVGQRLDETVALIRGAENTTVRLDILPAEADLDGKHKLISLVRKKISLDKQAAKKSIINVKEGGITRHIGVITLPGFYQDFAARERGDKNYKSASRDVARLLTQFQKSNIDGVVIDLRNNGGGSLDEAINLTGLFIDNGPVVQERDAKGHIQVENNTTNNVVWRGPLGVLINRGSASASEIFAAAVQDYGRGIVIGATSFGKGTVQSVINLDRLVKSNPPKFGELKMTIAQFFRIDGGTTQLHGVTPDITLPSMMDEEDFGESSYDNALPWSHIKPADYSRIGSFSEILPALLAKHNRRIATNKEFKYLQEDINEINDRRQSNKISLNEADRRHEREVQETRIKLREKAEGIHGNSFDFQDDGLQSGERNLTKDLAIEKARKGARDILLNEAANILGDEVGMLKSNPKLAENVLPKQH